jgi:predicted MFS family arabinose efflux permease
MEHVGEAMPETPRSLWTVLAAAAGLTVANLYYNQPLLGLIRGSFGVTAREVGLVATATQLGYGLSMLLLVPLGDRYERRGLIVGMTAASALALVGVALAPSLPALLGLSLVLGVTSMVPQYVVPFAAGLAGPSDRGRAVGTVMSGVLVGILLSRAVAGFWGARFGWRSMYGVAAGLMLLLALVLRAALPVQRPETRMPLRTLYRSLFSLVREYRTLRRHSLLGALTFAAFSAFWTTLVFHLAALPGRYGSETAGLFGLVGVAGALAAPVVGRLADRASPRAVNGLAIVAVMLGYLAFALFGGSLLGLTVGVVLLDVGAQANHISNQTRIFNLDPSRRSRLNTIYMSSYFAGGALGSALGTAVYARWRWPGVCALGLGFGAAALLILLADDEAR